MRKIGRQLLCGSALAALMVLMALAPAASANILVPGASGAPDLLSPSGTLLADTGIVAWSTGLVSGTAEEVVVADPTNTFCAGCLDFIIDIHNSSTSADGVVRSTAANFTGFSTDVGYNPGSSLLGGGTVAPTSVDRSLGGDTVGFNFGFPGLLPGFTSFDLVIETNASTFTGGVVNFIDGGVGSITAFAPLATPEPGSLLLLGSGLLSFGGLLRRRILGA